MILLIQIDGTFRVNKPPVLLGYQHDPRNRNIDAGLDVGVGAKDQTFLTMFITIEPQLTPAEAIKEKVGPSGTINQPRVLQEDGSSDVHEHDQYFLNSLYTKT